MILNMEREMFSIEKIIEQMKQQGTFHEPEKTFLTKRNEMMKELHEAYLRDKYNSDKINYVRWLKRNKFAPSTENIARWKKSSGEFRTPITPKSFASYWLAHIPTSDLYYLISIAKDKANRKESFNRWLFWAIKTNSVV